MALLAGIFWATFCLSYWTLFHWIFEETCGSRMMMPHAMSVTPTEITLRLPTLGNGPESWEQHPDQVAHQA
jgi:hypothetical protein